jgi:two-component system sensor histidine kinase UhpB
MNPLSQTTNLRILHVEDSEDDATLIQAELSAGGFSVASHRVETAAQMRAALAGDGWDLVISDFNLPEFSAMGALEILRTSNPDLPCIVVSGAIGEEAAVALMKAGASDFVMKQRLSRMAPAVERTLREAQMRREHRSTVEELQESEDRFRALSAHLPVVVFQTILYPDGSIDPAYVSEGCRAVLGVEPSAWIRNGNLLAELVISEDRPSFLRTGVEAATRLTSRNWEGRIRVGPERDLKWINLRAGIRRLPSGVVMSEGIITNVTESKLAEEALRASRQRLRALSGHVENIKEEERGHIAREIHDDLGGTLAAAKIDLAWLRNRLPADQPALAEKADAMQALMNHAIEATGRISRRLRPLVLDYGIAAAVEWQINEFRKRMGIVCEFLCPQEEIPLEPELATALFRIFQETLTNIAKHAAATRVDVALEDNGDLVLLTVVDDGCGVSPEDIQKSGSYGIRGMRERAEFLGGEIAIIPVEHGGTRVRVLVPARRPMVRE